MIVKIIRINQFIYQFLGVKYEPCATAINANLGTYSRPMHAKTRTMLQDIFDPEISQLEQMLGWNLNHWRSDDT